MSDLSTSRRGFLAAGVASALPFVARGKDSPEDALTILHLTDIHIRPELDAPQRCTRILRAIRERHPEIGLVINTGDSIYAADYGHITRERMLEQWEIWDKVVMPELEGLPCLHAIGNHDTWWAGPEGDEMRGVPYVCKRLGIERPYGAARHGGWEILWLENSRGSIDAKQQSWLFDSLDALPAAAPVIVASHLPLYSLAGDYAGGNMKGSKPLIDRFAGREGPVVALSGHVHIQSSESIWNIDFHCNGALSGAWWEPGKQGDGSYERTPAGYALLRVWPDGRSECHYHPLPAGS
ncbi:metallophosphoesterase family protein [Luteolibacter marinus]|uniref:metallophosphoesterase family protein n=1 Tax=Luteolibacter marinus TaxID=2776705 RepID=UPI001866A667|nr:metallophosphoesterase [Luteolibacter marinus]